MEGVSLEWDDETKISAPDEVSKPVTDGRDRAYLIVLAGTSVGEMYKLAGETVTIGRGDNADIRIVDDGISRKHCEILHQDKQLVVRDLGSTNGTYINGAKMAADHVLKDGDKIQVGSTTILKFTFHDSLDETFQRQMYESALRDGLTKIFNKKYFLDRLESEFAYAIRHQSSLSLVMFDIDHFKAINDTHGHLAGDYALTTLSAVIGETIRQEDVFARYGGEEFAVICRGVDLEGSAVFAERLRRLVAAHPFRYQDIALTITVSAGVATVAKVGMRQHTELIAAADDALYRAKRSGRNKVVSHIG